MTKSQVDANTAILPPQLFSHADQLAYWQSSPPSSAPATGWGGRICDLLASVNPVGLPMLTSLNAEDAFIRGENPNNYIMNPDSASTLQLPYDPAGSGMEGAFLALHAAGTQANALQRTYSGTMNHSLATASINNGALNAQGAPDFSSYFPHPTGYDVDTQRLTSRN